jgi:hypothetical protein
MLNHLVLQFHQPEIKQDVPSNQTEEKYFE